MPAHLFADTLIRPAFMDARERREMALAVHIRELAYLRFSNRKMGLVSEREC
jgi:hypothetical protein